MIITIISSGLCPLNLATSYLPLLPLLFHVLAAYGSVQIHCDYQVFMLNPSFTWHTADMLIALWMPCRRTFWLQSSKWLPVTWILRGQKHTMLRLFALQISDRPYPTPVDFSSCTSPELSSHRLWVATDGWTGAKGWGKDLHWKMKRECTCFTPCAVNDPLLNSFMFCWLW